MMVHTLRSKMTPFTLIFFVFVSSALSVQSEFNPGGPNFERIRYCEESRFDSRYPPTPVECCDERARCSNIILPNETKYNLTNPDPEWPRRQCMCDFRLYGCVMKNLDEAGGKIAKTVGFSKITCFREYGVLVKGTTRTPQYQFISLLEAVSLLHPRLKKPFLPR